MADLDVGIAARIAAHGLATLAGTTPRAYNTKAPQNPTYPCVVWREVTVVRRHAMGADTGVLEIPVQFTSYAQSLDDARLLDAQVRSCFTRFSGSIGGVAIQDCLIEGTEPDYDLDVDVWSVTTDAVFWIVGT